MSGPGVGNDGGGLLLKGAIVGALALLGVLIVKAPGGQDVSEADAGAVASEAAAEQVPLDPSLFPTFAEPTPTEGSVGLDDPLLEFESHAEGGKTVGPPGL